MPTPSGSVVGPGLGGGGLGRGGGWLVVVLEGPLRWLRNNSWAPLAMIP